MFFVHVKYSTKRKGVGLVVKTGNNDKKVYTDIGFPDAGIALANDIVLFSTYSSGKYY